MSKVTFKIPHSEEGCLWFAELVRLHTMSSRYRKKLAPANATREIEEAFQAFSVALDRWVIFRKDELETRDLTAYQRACRLLYAALKALRKVIDLFSAPSGLQQRLLTHVRIAAFFNERKVDARNLP